MQQTHLVQKSIEEVNSNIMNEFSINNGRPGWAAIVSYSAGLG